MTTSLASSPVLPIVMAGAAGLLVVGTFSSSATSNSQRNAEPTPTPVVATSVPATCKGKACTITFPKAGDFAEAFGTTVTSVQHYTDGAEVTIGATSIVSNLTIAAKKDGYTLKILKVEPTGVTVRITKA